MPTSDNPSGEISVPTLYVLRDQLQVLIAALTVGEGDAKAEALLAAVASTVDDAADVLAATEPDALHAVRAGFAHAAAGAHNESRTDFLVAFRRLSVLLLADTSRRPEAADEPTRRWPRPRLRDT